MEDPLRATGRSTRLKFYYLHQACFYPNLFVEVLDHDDKLKSHERLAKEIVDLGNFLNLTVERRLNRIKVVI